MRGFQNILFVRETVLVRVVKTVTPCVACAVARSDHFYSFQELRALVRT